MRRRRVHYAWVVLAVAFATLIVAAAIRSFPGIILKSLSINLLLFGLAGRFLGRLMDQFSPASSSIFLRNIRRLEYFL